MITLQQIEKDVFTLEEASAWTGQPVQLATYGLKEAISPDTLKKACSSGRLKAIKKNGTGGRGFFLTTASALQEYLKNFDPKNKTERKPVKRRSKKVVKPGE